MLNNQVSKAVRLAIAFGAVAATSVSVNAVAAEEDGAKKVERIEVTGSRIKRTDMENVVPVTTFDAADIQATGAPTLEQFVQNLSISNGGQYGSSTNNGGTGTVTMNLRGLGDSRTLVLVNGKRYSGDISTIPMAVIKRVDVLRDGASTIYGSDAIAGVVNFITDKEFEGAKVTARYQESSRGDGETKTLNFVTGVASDKGNIVFSGSFDEREAIYGAQRDFSSCPRTETKQADGSYAIECGGSGTTAPGSAYVPSIKKTVMLDGKGGTRPIQNADKYNFDAISILYQPLLKHSFYAAAGYELFDDSNFSSLKLTAEGAYTNRVSNQQMAPVGTFWGVEVPATNPGNDLGETVYAYRRLNETGGRTWEREVNEFNLSLGLEGELQNGWYWDVSYMKGNRRMDTEAGGRVHQERIGILANPEKCAANATCKELGVWNPFATNTLTQGMQDWVIVPMTSFSKSQDTQFQFNVAGDSGDLELPAGPISWAFGYERLTTDYRSVPDGAAGLGAIYGVASEGTEGAYSTKAVFAEFNVPVLSDLPFVERLDFIAAARRTEVSAVKKAEVTTKFGIEWRPSDELMVRANRSEGFRTPAIATLFAPRTNSAESYADPCENYGSSKNETLKANCAADGLAPDWTQITDQASAWTGGNPDIGPEKSVSYNLGIVYSPVAVEGLAVTLDYYDIEIKDVIGSLGMGTIATECYNSANFSSPLCAQIKGPAAYGEQGGVRRNALGNLSGVDLATQNLGFFNARGIDFDIAYGFETSAGKLDFTLIGTKLLELEHLEALGLTPTALNGQYGNDVANGGKGSFPEWKATLGTRFTADNYSVAYNVLFESGTDDYAPKKNGLSNSIDNLFYHDINASYYFDFMTVTLGVNNLLDEEPPYVSNGDNGMLIRSHRLTGRQYYLSTTFKF